MGMELMARAAAAAMRERRRCFMVAVVAGGDGLRGTAG
jgi:hypothetical protein